MEDLKISDMLAMQHELWEKHKDTWSPMEPKFGRNSLLWTFEELGEVIAIIKKQGENEIMNNSLVRGAFVEELSDVFMYLHDTLLRYGVSADEISASYINKHQHNMKRDYDNEYKKLNRA